MRSNIKFYFIKSGSTNRFFKRPIMIFCDCTCSRPNTIVYNEIVTKKPPNVLFFTFILMIICWFSSSKYFFWKVLLSLIQLRAQHFVSKFSTVFMGKRFCFYPCITGGAKVQFFGTCALKFQLLYNTQISIS